MPLFVLTYKVLTAL